jgi:2-C-methyl-D-erythritol 4-phosphate cytidylyltransferase
MSQKIVALVPAAGTGTRLGDALPKQYIDVNGAPLMLHTLGVLAQVPRIEKIIVVLSPDDAHWEACIGAHPQWSGIASRVEIRRVGGQSRAESVLNGIETLADVSAQDCWVLVHDAARPCLRPELVEQFLDELEADAVGGLLALPLADTIKLDEGNLRVAKTLPRENIWRAQTPQMFRRDMLRKALQKFPRATDEAQAIEGLGHQPRLVMGDSANLKVTYAADLRLASMLLKESSRT